MKKAIYPLSADPIHIGHLYNTEIATKLFDKLYVAIGNNPEKSYLFNIDERVYLTKKALSLENVVVEKFSGLLRNYAKERGAEFLVRGARNEKDFDYEQKLAEFNNEYDLETLILPSPNKFRNLSSAIIKAVAVEGGFVHEYVHPAVKQALEERLWNVNLIAVTGNMGAGKTFFCQQFMNYMKNKGLEINHIDFDKLVHSLYKKSSPLYDQTRKEIIQNFGNVFDGEELDREKLSQITFGDDEKRETLAKILRIPSMIQLEKTLRKMNGIVLVDAAYFVEYDMLPLVNYNVILIGCDEKQRIARVLKRDNIDLVQLNKKLTAQLPYEKLENKIRESQQLVNHGFLYEVDTTDKIDFDLLIKKLKENFPLIK